MLRVSNKGRAIPESPIRKLVPYAEAAKKTWCRNISFKYWTA